MNFTVSDASLITVETFKEEGTVAYYTVNIKNANEKAHIEWAEPMLDCYSVWHPMCGRGRQVPQWFGAQKTESCFYRGAPVMAVISASGHNKFCAAFSDTVSPVSLGFYVDDFSGKNLVFFTLDITVNQPDYTAVIRIDKSDIPFEDAVHNVSRWWNAGIKKSVPEDAYAPLYSSWYNFHQDPNQAELTAELKCAAELGFKTFILDDGWQIDGNGTKDYLLSGDWTVAQSKFPDFKQFVADVHGFGMKCMMWFSVPFVGFKTEAYCRFRDKLLYEEEGYLNAGILDIRYPEVRRYLTETYAEFIRMYDVDGLKLDFIDNFGSRKNIHPVNPAMDCETVEKAVIVLLNEIKETVCSLKSDFLFEYRQFYVGPSILAFGNMIRVADCAFDPVTNRIGVADLRILTDNIAVHSDMLLWSPDETTENCALQLLNVIFSAVQISVLLRQSTEKQRALLKAFIRYITKNRDVLLKGKFRACHPELNYTALSSEKEETGQKITVLYADEVYKYCGGAEDIWNATKSDYMVVLNPNTFRMDITIIDFEGNTLNALQSENEVISLNVPSTGMIHIEKNINS